MEIQFNNKTTKDSEKIIIEKEVVEFINTNKNKSNFEELKKSFLRNRNYSFSLSDKKVIIYTV